MEHKGRSPDSDPAMQAVNEMVRLMGRGILHAATDAEANEFYIMQQEWLARREEYLRQFYGITD